jgi:transposase InsO family protein
MPVVDNILDRDFEADAPNQKWVTDITYIPPAKAGATLPL